MFNICIQSILYELCLAKKKDGERRRKKEDKQNQNFQVWLSQPFLKVSETFRVDLALK